ncbi:hypothetical protein D9M72_595070 [compost metagenome]
MPSGYGSLGALRSGENGERGPFLRKTLAELDNANLSRNELVIATAAKEMIAETVLQIRCEDICSADGLDLVRNPLKRGAHELVAARRARPVVL